MTSERDRWLEGEADAYYERNVAALVPHRDPVVRLLDEEGVPPGSVVELGCANGWRLATLCERALVRGARIQAVGIEPSRAATRDGRRMFGERVDLLTGHAAESWRHLADRERYGGFHCVVLAFVLHWLPRADLPAVVRNVRALRRAGGTVVIADFLPDHPQRVRYKHAPGLWTYKEDYGAWLSGALHLGVRAMRAFDHRAPETWAYAEAVPARERCAVWLLGPKRRKA